MAFLCFTADSDVVTLADPGWALRFLGVTEVPLAIFGTADV